MFGTRFQLHLCLHTQTLIRAYKKPFLMQSIYKTYKVYTHAEILCQSPSNNICLIAINAEVFFKDILRL